MKERERERKQRKNREGEMVEKGIERFTEQGGARREKRRCCEREREII